MHIEHNVASSFHCQLEFKMPLPPAKKQKSPACIREIQVHKLWTKVYSQKGLTAMECWSKVWTSTIKMRIYLLAIPQAEHPILPLDLHLLKSCSECSVPEPSSSDNGHQSPWSTDSYWISVSVLFPDLSATPSPFETDSMFVLSKMSGYQIKNTLDFG